MSPLPQLTSCMPTKTNFYLANSLAAAVSELALYRLLTFQVPNILSFFRCLGHTRVSVHVPGSCKQFITWYFLWWGVVSTSPNPQAGGPATLRIGGCSSIHNRRMCHDIVTGTHLLWALEFILHKSSPFILFCFTATCFGYYVWSCWGSSQ
jgi:hypothetical protein